MSNIEAKLIDAQTAADTADAYNLHLINTRIYDIMSSIKTASDIGQYKITITPNDDLYIYIFGVLESIGYNIIHNTQEANDLITVDISWLSKSNKDFTNNFDKATCKNYEDYGAIINTYINK